MRLRFESWGAWARIDGEGASKGAIVALKHEHLSALGLPAGSRAANEKSAPLEVHMAVNSRCGAGCKGCYLNAVPEGAELSRTRLEAQLEDLKSHGVFTVAFGGGEPTLRRDLGELADFARSRGITPVVTTSGLGLSSAKVDALARFEQVNVSLDGVGTEYRNVRGFDGSEEALEAIRTLTRRGVQVGINLVLTRNNFAFVETTVAHARNAGAREVQLLRYKPAGRAANETYTSERLTEQQVLSFPALLRRLAEGGMSARIDCSLVPFLSSDPDLYARPDDLTRFGIFGCEAGEALLAFRADGFAAGCSFATRSDARTIEEAKTDRQLEEWRRARRTPDEPCASCNFRTICKGGCAVVRRFLTGNDGPDPECPRVRALETTRASRTNVSRRALQVL